MRDSEIARAAAEIMSERGHCKSVLEDEQGRVCLVGALLAATGEAELRRGWVWCTVTARRVVERIMHAVPGFGGDIWDAVRWNNEEDTTGEEVILLLKRTAGALEERGE